MADCSAMQNPCVFDYIRKAGDFCSDFSQGYLSTMPEKSGAESQNAESRMEGQHKKWRLTFPKAGAACWGVYGCSSPLDGFQGRGGMLLQVCPSTVLHLFFAVAQLAIGLGDATEGFDPFRVAEGQDLLSDGKSFQMPFQRGRVISQIRKSTANIVVGSRKYGGVGRQYFFRMERAFW